MKKNVMMRIASVLLVAVLLSTSAISGTFAKYVTEANGSDTARVAKFGVKITANGSMFGQHYTAATDNSVATSVTGSVDTSAGDNIVAPGTKGTMASMGLSGTPEVRVAVSYEGTVTMNGKWETQLSADDTTKTYYCPLKVTVGTTEISGLDYNSEAAFAAAIKTAIDGTTKTYNAGTDLSTVGTDALAISWEWAFEGASGTKVARTDYRDTYLGDQAANGNAANITIAVTTTVTQVD